MLVPPGSLVGFSDVSSADGDHGPIHLAHHINDVTFNPENTFFSWLLSFNSHCVDLQLGGTENI